MYKIFLYPRYLSCENVIPLKTDFFTSFHQKKKKKRIPKLNAKKDVHKKWMNDELYKQGLENIQSRTHVHLRLTP